MDVISRSRDFLKSDLPVFAGLVKFSHSIFALPFALSMFLVVAKMQPVTFGQLAWIIVSLVSARTAAMGFNRVLDRKIDARNPRTLQREIPSNKIRLSTAVYLVTFSSLLFFFASWKLGVHCLYLAPLVLAFLFFYSYTKRFTHYAHIVLGIALALAPGGVWYALTSEFALLPIIMIIAVTFWVAGFDIIYSCQDVDFDRANNLHSIPAVLGVKKALSLSLVFHVLTVCFLVTFGLYQQYGIPYFLGLTCFSLVLFSQHLIVKPNDLSKADSAFFTRNGIASFIFLIGMFFEYLIGK